MAKKFLTNIDLNKNELQNAILQPLATAPDGAKLGQIYYNSASKKLYQFDGSAWELVGVTYDLSATASSNTANIKLVGTDGSSNVVAIKGAGGATITGSGSTITITTKNDNTTYTFTGEASASGYTVTIKPSIGSAQTVSIPLATASNAGLLSPAEKTKLAGLPKGSDIKLDVGDGQADFEATLKLLNSIVKISTENSFLDILPQPENNSIGFRVKAPDTSMSSSSDNYVQNKVIKSYVDNIITANNGIAYKGTLESATEVPKTYKVGWLYVIGTAGTYAGQLCEVGDMMIALVERSGSGNTDADWSVIQTNIAGAITAITGTTPITVSGSGASRTIELDNSGATAGTYGNNSNVAPEFGGTFVIPALTVDAKGRVTGISNKTITAPNAVATSSANGLMSAQDKKDFEIAKAKTDELEVETGEIGTSATTTTITLPAGFTPIATKCYMAHEEVITDIVANAETETLTVSVSTAPPSPIKIFVFMVQTNMEF